MKGTTLQEIIAHKLEHISNYIYPEQNSIRKGQSLEWYLTL